MLTAIFSVIITSLVLIAIDMIISNHQHNKLLKVQKRKNRVMNLNAYLRQDRVFIVKKMNDTRETIEFCRKEYQNIMQEIAKKQEEFANGIDSKVAESETESYLNMKYAREDLAKTLKKSKKEFARYSRILAIIDNNMYLGV